MSDESGLREALQERAIYIESYDRYVVTVDDALAALAAAAPPAKGEPMTKTPKPMVPSEEALIDALKYAAASTNRTLDTTPYADLAAAMKKRLENRR